MPVDGERVSPREAVSVSAHFRAPAESFCWAELPVYFLELHFPAPLVGFRELVAGSRAPAARWRVPRVARQEPDVPRALHSAC